MHLFGNIMEIDIVFWIYFPDNQILLCEIYFFKKIIVLISVEG